MIRLRTFGFKHLNPVDRAGAMVDCRSLRNPHQDRRLRLLDGRDEAVQKYVKADPNFQKKLKEARYAASYSGGGDGICWIGCYGGRHRSVAVAEILADELKNHGFEVTVEHSQLPPLHD